MRAAIIFDCEFLCLQGSQGRFWSGAHDPDPVIAQIGAVKLSLEPGYHLLDTFKSYVRPVDRFEHRYAIDPFFAKLTGITEEVLEAQVVTLAEALADVDQFAEGARFWSWGKDELNMIAISFYIAGLQPPIPAYRFDNAVKLLVAAGMPMEDIAKIRTNQLADYYGVEHPPLRGHDALDDALSVSYALQHLLRTKKLPTVAFDST